MLVLCFFYIRGLVNQFSRRQLTSLWQVGLCEVTYANFAGSPLI